MRIRPRTWLLAAGLCGLAVSAGGCGGGDPAAGHGLSGTIRVDGSSALYPFAKLAADEFQKANPSVRITIGQSGTDSGLNEFCAGETDLADVGRAMNATELAACAKQKVGFAALQVASDGVAVVAGPTSRVRCLSMLQLAQLWGNGSKVDKLSLLGVDPGTGRRLSKGDLTLYGPPGATGPYDLFTTLVNGQEGTGRTDYSSFDQDEAIAHNVALARGAIGYLSFIGYRRSAEPVNLVNVDGGSGCIAPSVGTIQDSSYALSSRLLVYPSRRALIEHPALRPFLRFVERNYKTLAARSGVVPMSAASAGRSSEKLEALPSAPAKPPAQGTTTG